MAAQKKFKCEVHEEGEEGRTVNVQVNAELLEKNGDVVIKNAAWNECCYHYEGRPRLPRGATSIEWTEV